MLTCVVCGSQFERQGSRGPVPKYCSQRCITKASRTPRRVEYERLYRRGERLLGKRKLYEFEYNRRPYVREKNRKRMLWKWHNDPEYRENQLLRWRTTVHPEVVIPAPYSGHIWLDMAREVVRKDVDPTTPWADNYWDDMGEAVLALLEGRDMKEAVKEFRRKEFVERHLTHHLGDWHGDPEKQNQWFEAIMPQSESAEDEVMANESVKYYIADRFKDVSTKNRTMKHKTQQPSRRRMNNK